eukprot:c14850_g1_i1.p1 GENE.c14850_g1_i1~~c14850_g1_i1.p1  ORF type:complete len:310 (+),score=120.33 c14850_g1_i1:82-1011(+)
MAGNIAFKHCRADGYETPLLVTVSVDRISANDRPVISKNMEMSGVVTRVGRSSLDIGMEIRIKDNNEPWLKANFTFVARNPKNNEAFKINPLKLETDEQRKLFEEGEKRSLVKKKLRATHPFQLDPNKHQKVQQLLEKAQTQVRLASLADSNSVLMETTKIGNVLTCQPQHQNIYGRIFGGFLLRRAFEIAFSGAYMFIGTKPDFVEVDEVVFRHPVDVGDLLIFESKVLYTSNPNDEQHPRNHLHPLVHIEVIALIAKPETVSTKISNTFNFTFSAPNTKRVKSVLPGNLDEATRMVSRMIADELQGH